jgi:hypothetical protein
MEYDEQLEDSNMEDEGKLENGGMEYYGWRTNISRKMPK